MLLPFFNQKSLSALILHWKDNSSNFLDLINNILTSGNKFNCAKHVTAKKFMCYVREWNISTQENRRDFSEKHFMSYFILQMYKGRKSIYSKANGKLRSWSSPGTSQSRQVYSAKRQETDKQLLSEKV